MNTSKFSLADLLTVLAALVFGFFSFLSFNFLSLGETMQSIGLSLVLALILGGLAYGAKLLKKTSRNFKTCIIVELVLLFLFLCAALLAVKPFSHYFAISEKKGIIQPKIVANITQAEGMFLAYESYSNARILNYHNKLKSIVLAENIRPIPFNNSGFKHGDNTIRIRSKTNILKNRLYPSTYKQIKKQDSTWLANAKAAISNWKPIGIVNVIFAIERNITDWKAELVNFSKFRAIDENENTNNFVYSIDFTNVNDNFENLGNPTMTSIILVIILYLLMLLTYFITPRHSRYPGLKVIFSSGKTSENEL